MALFRERAIILRHQELSGADKIVTFLTAGQGKVKVVAKGARRPKSRFSGSLEPLSLVELVYFAQPQREVLARLNQCEVLEAFDSLRDDYGRLVRGLYLMELADALLKEGVTVTSCFENLLGSLEALRDGVDEELVRWGCAWRLLNSLGYSPTLSACVVCRATVGLEAFNPGLGGCLCSGCRTPQRDGLALSSGARASLLRLGELAWDKMGRLALTGPTRQEVGRVVEAYLRQYLDRKLKSEDLLEES